MQTVCPVELVCDPRCLLAESPLWAAAESKLYFTDIEEGCLWKCDPATGNPEMFWRSGLHVGGFAFNLAGDLILCADNKVLKLYKNGTLETLFDLDFPAGERFNDITTDPLGRIYAGTTTPDDRPGRLLCFEKGRPSKVLLTGIVCSNGMSFSLDEKFFFHTNTGAMTITKYNYARATGEIGNGKIFFQGNSSMGLPDGLTLDSENCLWAAFWDGGVIRRFSPEGHILQVVELPAKRPTSVIFGGAKLDELFITTASVGRVSADNRVNKNGEFFGGGIYRFKPNVRGRAEWPANF